MPGRSMVPLATSQKRKSEQGEAAEDRGLPAVLELSRQSTCANSRRRDHVRPSLSAKGEIAMKRNGTKLVPGFIFVGAVLMAACAKPYHEQNERYVFVATNIKLPYWQEAEAGFLDAASALGVKGELVGPTGYQPNAELGVFREIVEQHPAGICLSAARPEIFKAEIDKAVAQGIPVICVDSDVADSKRVLYIGTDNFKAGTESLKQMAALVPGG